MLTILCQLQPSLLIVIFQNVFTHIIQPPVDCPSHTITSVYVVCFSESPNVTAGGLRQLLGAFTSLEDITLAGGLDGAVHETTLSVLNGCSQLQILQLGDANRIYTDIPAAAVSRSDSRH